MACKTITETLKELRDTGATPAQLKEAKRLMQEIKDSKSEPSIGSNDTQLGDRSIGSDSAYAKRIKAKEDKIIQQMGGTITIGNTTYDIKSLRINADNVSIRMQKGDTVKMYSFPFGRSTSLPTAKWKTVTTSYLHLYTEDLKRSGSNSYEEAYTERRTAEESATTMGSVSMDEHVKENMANGTYTKLDIGESLMGILSGAMNLNGILGAQVQQADSMGYKFNMDHLDYAAGFIGTITNLMKQMDISDIKHKFEVYQTDNEFTTAFWEDGLGLDEDRNVDGGKIVLLLGKNMANGTDSLISNNAELILHEVSHSVTELAMRQDRRLSRKVEQIQKEVMKKLKYTDLLAGIENPTVAEIARAKELMRYMNGNPSEFLAYAVSNQYVFAAMSNMPIQIDTFALSGDKDAGAFTKTIDMIKTIINQVLSMMVNGPSAAQAFSNALEDVMARNMQLRAKMYVGNTFDDYAAKVTGDKYEKVNEFMKAGSEKIEAKIFSLGLMSPKTKGAISDFVDTLGEIKYIQDIKESGIVQSIMHQMFRQTTDKEFAASFQLIRQIKTDNDKYQNSLKEININLVHSWFKDIDGDQREAVTDLLAADVNSLGVDRKTLAELISNQSALDAWIGQLKTEIGADEYLFQARDLGWYMMHGESKNPKLQTNAHRIYYRMYAGPHKQNPLVEGDPKEMIAKIDKLASLYALKYIDAANKSHLSKLLKDETAVAKNNDITDEQDYHVVDLALHFYATSLEEEKADFGEAYSMLMDKGYLRKAYKLQMKTRIVPESLKSEMIKRGYSPEVTFSQAATDMRGDGQDYYIMYAPDYSASRTQGAIHDIGYFDKVQQMSDVYDGHNVVYEENSRLVEQQKIVNRLYDGFQSAFTELGPDEMMARKNNLMPVMRLDGTIVDYSVPISRADGINHMEQDMDIASVLAATVTHRSAKRKAIRGNIEVVKHLLATELMHEDDDDYVVLRRSNKEELDSGKPYKYDKQYAMIPEYTRDYINRKRQALGMTGDPDSIRIHKDMIDDFIGYKDFSITDFKLGTDGKYFDMSAHPVLAMRAEQVQYWIKKAVARYKTLLVILNPEVIAGNTISNFNMATVHGIDPATYSKLFVRYWKHLDDYNETHAALLRTTAEKDAGMSGLNGKIESLELQLKANPMHELMKDGQFNMIVEDIDTYNNKEDHVEYQKRRIMEKAIGKEGTKKAQSVIETIALTKNSVAFKAIEKLTIYNDIINRRIVMDKLLYDMEVGITGGSLLEADREVMTREILDYVDQLFVNYSYLDNRYIKYANDMGLILFTKYYLRALKTLKQVYDKKPLSMTMFLGLEGFDLLPSMFDESPYKGYASPLDSLVNRLGPMTGNHFGEMIQKLLTPASFDVL